MGKRYTFDARDRTLLTAAAALLKKVAVAETLEPARLVSSAKLQHLFSRLPHTAPDMEVSVSVVGQRHKFDDIETWHYWDVAVEQKRLSISSGGHYNDPCSGGDSFTTMTWSAVSGESTVYDDYRETLWMVPDVQSFPEGVATIDFASSGYKIEVSDSENPLLSNDEDINDNTSLELAEKTPDRTYSVPISPQITPTDSDSGALQIPLDRDTTFRLHPSPGDYLLFVRCTNPFCCQPEFVIADFWEFREGDVLLVTNREEDYPAPAEQMEQMEQRGPSLWKVLPGDRLAWVGFAPGSLNPEPSLLGLIICFSQGYVYGEPGSPNLDSIMSFGAPTSEPTPEVQRLWKVGYDAAVAMGLPRTWKPPV